MPTRSIRAGLLLLVGCSSGTARPPATEPTGGQTYAEAISLLCQVDARAGLSGTEDPIELGQKRHAWLSERIKNPDGIYFYTLWRVKPPREQADTLRHEAKEAGLGACALAESLAHEASD